MILHVAVVAAASRAGLFVVKGWLPKSDRDSKYYLSTTGA